MQDEITLNTAAEKQGTDVVGWLHLARVSVARVVLWFVFSLIFFAMILVPSGRFDATVVATGSMRPQIGPGDVVVTKALTDDTPVLGHVVTAEDPASWRPPAIRGRPTTA